MNKGLIFFCCACIILVFTIINLSVGPISSGRIRDYVYDYGTLNCKKYKDDIDRAKKKEGKTDDDLKYGLKWKLDECQREKGMNDMEYTSFIFNVVIGFICGLLGLLHLFVDKKEYVNRTGLIGLCCGIVGFIFSFVYIILNGLVYTTVDIGIIKRDGDGVFAEKTGTSGQFKCLYYDENPHKLHATISDLIKKQYNYDKDMYKNVDEDCIDDPYGSPSFSSQCFSSETIAGPNKCENLYAKPENEIDNKDLSDRFLTTLLLSLFVCLANVGLAIFGFLIFRSGEF